MVFYRRYFGVLVCCLLFVLCLAVLGAFRNPQHPQQSQKIKQGSKSKQRQQQLTEPIDLAKTTTTTADAVGAATTGLRAEKKTMTTTTTTTTKARDAETQLPKFVLFVTSGLGGIFGWILIHPANTLTIRMNLVSMSSQQQQKQQQQQRQHWLQWWLSLYDGLTAGIWRQVFYATSRFGLFEVLRDAVHQWRGGTTDFAARAANGAITGGMAALIASPMELAVVRLSNDCQLPIAERRNYQGVGDAVIRIVKEEGILALWRGSHPFIVRAMTVGVFQVALLDQIEEMVAAYYDIPVRSLWNVLIAAMISGFICSLVTMPLESSKNRMTSQKPDPVTGALPYREIFQTVLKVAREEGFWAHYKGFWSYYIKCGGHTIAMFVMVKLIRDLYRVHFM